MKHKMIGTVYLLLAVLLVQIRVLAQEAPGVRAVTRPSADVQLSFVQPGRIAEIMAFEGSIVLKGEKLIQLDDTVEQVVLAQILAASQDMTQILAGRASLDQKRLDLKKLEKAAAYRAATDLEVEHARLDVTIAELTLKMAEFEHDQAILKFKETQKRIEHMRLVNPINGIVEQISVETGESVNALDEVIRIVQIDPLWIDASVPLDIAKTLKDQQAIQVEFPLPQQEVIQGKVIYISSVADAGSGTLKVRVEVPNASSRPAGEHVRVICSMPQ